ncbi:MAG: chorismate mutase, partial [Planctomycetes bacterium]|nr:chorismate mutase [Planctomycetota bacterium]
LKKHRNRIDRTGELILSALAERVDFVTRILSLKESKNFPLLDPHRERLMLAAIAGKAGKYGLDPSHAAGKRAWVPPPARAAKAVGCDGIIVEVHPEPARAKSDAARALTPDQFAEMMKSIR